MIEAPDGMYVVRNGVIYKILPRVANAFKIAKKINIKTGEVIYSTNADRIREMTDKELAEFMLSTASEFVCYPEASSVDCERFAFDCKKCWLYWLKQEVET